MNKPAVRFVPRSEPKENIMNTKFVLASVFAAVSGFAGVANTATAGTDLHLGIFFGRVPAPVVVVSDNCAPARPVVVEYRREEPRGYWKDVVVKTWIPARWVVSRGFYGRPVRNLEPGYFAYSTERVWVDLGRSHEVCLRD